MCLGDELEEVQELDVGVPVVAGIGDLAGRDLQGCEQAGGAVALVVVGLLLRKPGPQRQDRRGPVQRLDLGLLIDAEPTDEIPRPARPPRSPRHPPTPLEPHPTAARPPTTQPIPKQGSRLVRWAAVESVQLLPAHTKVGAVRERVAARRGRNIGVVAAARAQIELVYYALRDHHVRALHPRARPCSTRPSGNRRDGEDAAVAAGDEAAGRGRAAAWVRPGQVPALDRRQQRLPGHPRGGARCNSPSTDRWVFRVFIGKPLLGVTTWLRGRRAGRC